MQNIDNAPEGWSFVIDRIEVKSTGGLVYGWFMYFRLETTRDPVAGILENLVTHYITPFNTPSVLKIPRFLFDKASEGDTVVDLEIGPKEIYSGLLRLFNMSYTGIPSPRIEVPLHTIPPSRREELLRRTQPWLNK